MFIKTRQGRLGKKEKAIDEETLDAIVSLFVLMKYVWKLDTFYLFITLIVSDSLSFTVPLKIQVHMGKKHLSHCLGKKSLVEFVVIKGLRHPQHWRKIKKIDALKREHVIERNDIINKVWRFGVSDEIRT